MILLFLLLKIDNYTIKNTITKKMSDTEEKNNEASNEKNMEENNDKKQDDLPKIDKYHESSKYSLTQP